MLTSSSPVAVGFFHWKKDLTWVSHEDMKALINSTHPHTETHFHAFEADYIIFFLYHSFKENINLSVL